ncbi:helix-turn-helix domain-containing protein [Maribellus sp. YY47]|uniref:helix-turn-helix domain-containing protein n=1 Tax=Maribellus sp. YY47 TaxID=2929486 RepID=UPI002000BE78|nr:helix-turn-helix domain-containing protein [Maribellus sp. YY47]MCK3683084.1 helix-turn-helix domain-containing protein [Maribellus sp. YY47]
MQNDIQSKVGVNDIAKQKHEKIIDATSGFISSKEEMDIGELLINYQFPNIIEEIAFVFCLEGNAKIKINLIDYEVHKDSVTILGHNNIVQILDHSDDFRISFLFFTFDFFSSIRLPTQLGDIAKTIETQPCLYPSKPDFEKLLATQQLINLQYGSSDSYRDEIVRNLLYALVYQLLQQYVVNANKGQQKAFSRKQDIYMKFMTLLFEKYKIERSVQFYADQLHLTRKYFSRVVLEVSNKKPSEWIEEMVVMTAKALLKGSDMTAAQIADDLNFSSSSFFGAYFKKRVNLSPLQYREL